MKEMFEGIFEGDLFLCVKTCCYDNGSSIIFKKGKIYHSYRAGAIKDEDGFTYHRFSYEFWTKYLIKIGNNDSPSNSNYDSIVAQRLNIVRLLGKYGYAYNFKTKQIIKKQ